MQALNSPPSRCIERHNSPPTNLSRQNSPRPILPKCIRSSPQHRITDAVFRATSINRETHGSSHRTAINEGVLPAHESEFATLRLGPHLQVAPPVVLAPMAGITNASYRKICREEGAGLCVSEMVIAHLLAKRHPPTLKQASFLEGEGVRSIQLYGTDAKSMGEAARVLIDESRVDHIDLNFGCPMKKITAKGGGAAVAQDPGLIFRLVRACTEASDNKLWGGGQVPVTIKIRMGLTAGKPTYLEAGMAAQDAGAAWVALHARSAEQMYAPPAHWDAIADLAGHLSVPVLGNGDVSRGQGGGTDADADVPPWLFRELDCVLRGEEPPPPPPLAHVLNYAQRHLEGLIEWVGDEKRATLQMRKLVPLYFFGFDTAKEIERKLMKATCLEEWHALVESSGYDPLEPFPMHSLRHERLKGGGGGGG